MTVKEIFHEITSTPRWHKGFCTPQLASKIKWLFNKGKLEFETIEKLFNHHGYYYCTEWVKL